MSSCCTDVGGTLLLSVIDDDDLICVEYSACSCYLTSENRAELEALCIFDARGTHCYRDGELSPNRMVSARWKYDELIISHALLMGCKW